MTPDGANSQQYIAIYKYAGRKAVLLYGLSLPIRRLSVTKFPLRLMVPVVTTVNNRHPAVVRMLANACARKANRLYYNLP